MSRAMTETQKTRLRVLEPQLDEALRNQDLKAAKRAVLDIQNLLRPTEHFARLVQSKNKLYELSIELGKCSSALSGLLSNRRVLNENTRIYLETTSLIAICYLRLREIEKAKVYIKEVLTNYSVIRTQRTREKFHSEIIDRFNEEVAFASLVNTGPVNLSEDEIEQEVVRIIQTLTEEEMFSKIGQASPNATKDLIFIIHSYSTKQLPSAERLALPSPDQKIKDKEVGITVFESIKRVVYNSLCNPDSDIYKTWFNNGAGMVLSKGYIRTAVVSCFVKAGIGLSMLTASIIALIMKFGIEVYCTKYKPKYVFEIRNK